MKKIFIADSVSEQCVKELESAGYKVNYSTNLSPEELKSEIKDYNALVVRSATKVTADLISAMNNMEVIGRAGTGVDNIDLDAATRKGILVLNTPGGNTISAAEHTIAMILSMCRNIPQANKSLSDGKWERKKFKGTELKEKTLGLVGFGRIGREVAKRALSFDMNVIAFDPIVSEDVAEKLNVKLVSLDDIFSQSDIISLHIPLTDATKNLINKETIYKCKKGVRIVNCARGGLIDEDALVKAIDEGQVSSAAIDVFKDEPPPEESPVLSNEKIVCTPHLGASTSEAQEKVAIQIARQIIDYFENNKIQGAVNAPAAKTEVPEKIFPFIKLSEVIGKLHSQLLSERIKEIEIKFLGEELHEAADLLTASLLKGLLTGRKEQSVNLINAPVLAKDDGIIVNQIKSEESRAYLNLISAEIKFAGSGRVIEGTVVGKNELRIVNIDGFQVEFNPEGSIVIYYNIDKPGVLANFSKVLADSKVNIAGVSLGRIEERNEALTVVKVDGQINKNLLKHLQTIEGINYIYSVDI